MHRVLLINEIILTVAHHVPADKDLSALARVCKSFSNPALDVLWSALGSIVPLLRCLPSDLIKETLHEGGCIASYTLKRPFTAADWTILWKYSWRVTALNGITRVGPDESVESERGIVEERIDPTIFGVLCSPPVSRLFPRLRKLACADVHARDPLAFFRSLLVPSITELSFFNSRVPMDVCTQSLISLLPSICPAVQRFSWLGLPSSPAKWPDVLSAAACHWGRLTHLRCLVLNSSALQHLSLSRFLQELDVTLEGHFPDDLSLGPEAFPVIRTLRLSSPRGKSLAIISTLLRRSRFSPTNLALFADTANDGAIAELIEVISAHCCRSVLRYLELTERNDILPHHPALASMTRLTLLPLFHFTALTHLKISTGHLVALDDQDILKIAGAFEDLQELHINDGYGWGPHSRISLRCLRALLARAPNLKSLAVAIDGEHPLLNIIEYAVPTNEATFRSPHVASGDFSLNLLDSRVTSDNLVNVAAFLSDLFPNVVGFGASPITVPRRDGKQYQRWRYVMAMMNVMSQATPPLSSLFTVDPWFIELLRSSKGYTQCRQLLIKFVAYDKPGLHGLIEHLPHSAPCIEVFALSSHAGMDTHLALACLPEALLRGAPRLRTLALENCTIETWTSFPLPWLNDIDH
ncbi:hypothetical protein CONPUDRAFT_167528 [Coniophora puteana RWD-64-598 SS2]|uniref:F-box domain-containing protein n=1 Tax=Coniophora puteana (strain RWD-64-598) TaxID=741705 RepID=A0A5M3MIC1_CONPW|nr:uncharacterized protein CONPUDRAFT_167528 [Coniophora puteana RWD-64-598 SS2]EIW78534.1 hypothetical protein CONPUDRAFT_167528 [Coniophora puteana RWD-64-598 SS2]